MVHGCMGDLFAVVSWVPCGDGAAVCCNVAQFPWLDMLFMMCGTLNGAFASHFTPVPLWLTCCDARLLGATSWTFGVGFFRVSFVVHSYIRARHDGRNRCPWNEPECGLLYSRAMAGWNLFDQSCGFLYDATKKVGFRFFGFSVFGFLCLEFGVWCLVFGVRCSVFGLRYRSSAVGSWLLAVGDLRHLHAT
jgi:hypothetical protein